MSEWQVVFLGIMAVALAAMAVAQVVISLSLVRTSRQVAEAVRDVQRDLKPLIDNATRLTDDAARVTALALVQAERVDKLVSTLTTRVDETMAMVQEAVMPPIRQGATLVAAFRAVVAAIREWKGQRGPGREDDDPLFVG